MVDGHSRVRPHWRRLFPALAELGRDVLIERGQALDRLFIDDGVTSLLPGADPARRRLDPIPLILSAAEFADLEVGLAQRARLLEAILSDVYGPCALLAEGLLPPALVYANPAFLRPCRTTLEGKSAGQEHQGLQEHQRLHMYAAELVRGPDGAWRVIADRANDAGGAGYAVDNRRSLTLSMPELFQTEQQLRRLRPFFELWQDVLRQLAPRVDNPGVALLTAGSGDKLWFEHVVLAHELSCTLVEPGDLTVRDGKLFLKTLRGLRQVDVLLRRQDGRSLDPLELDSTTEVGIPGLLDAMRNRTVRIVNAPGAGFVEVPGLAPFLPMISRRLLGEELTLPNGSAMALRDRTDREVVFRAPESWRIRPALDAREPAISLSRLSPGDLASLAERVNAAPDLFVATSVVPPSVAPCAGPEGLEARPVLLRMFLLFDGTRWRTMPGGFARVLSPEDTLSGRLPLHGMAKDVWVLGEDVLDIIGPPNPTVSSVPIRRITADLPSRVADNFFWLGRYLERAEGTARLLLTTADRLGRPSPTPREIAELNALLSCVAAFHLVQPEALHNAGDDAQAMALLGVAREGGKLPRLLTEVSRLAKLLRDRLTGEVHTVLTGGLRALMDTLRALPAGLEGTRGLEPLGRAMTAVLSFSATVAGLAAENMVRGGGRLFLDLGRRVERAQAIATELAQVLDLPEAAAHPARLDSGLRLALVLRDSVITYRNRYLSTLQPAPILDLILADEGNPRALAFQLAAARDLLIELDGHSKQTDGRIGMEVTKMLDEVRAMPNQVAVAANQAAAATRLAPRLRALASGIAALSDSITREYFALLSPPHRLEANEETAQPRSAA